MTTRTIRQAQRTLVLLLMVCGLQGCIIGTAIDVAAETVEAGVGITGAVVGTAVDVVTPDGKKDKDDD